LSRHETGVYTSLREQFRMRALLHYAALVQYDNQIGVAYSGEPMRNQQRSTSRHETLECFMDKTLVLGIKV
jgi:hypothetical protein